MRIVNENSLLKSTVKILVRIVSSGIYIHIYLLSDVNIQSIRFLKNITENEFYEVNVQNFIRFSVLVNSHSVQLAIQHYVYLKLFIVRRVISFKIRF